MPSKSQDKLHTRLAKLLLSDTTKGSPRIPGDSSQQPTTTSGSSGTTTPTLHTIKRPHYPNEILDTIMQNLETKELVACSYTSWVWNHVANIYLYGNIHIKTVRMFSKLLNTVAKRSGRRHTLSELIRVVNIQYSEYDLDFKDYPEYFHLERFASACPNVHTFNAYESPRFLVLYFADGNKLFWPELAKKWPKLKHVSVHSNGHFLGGKDPSQGIEHILSNLHSLDLLRCRGFLASIRLSLPSASVLRSLKIQIGHVSEYDNLKNLVTSCRNTLETLAISWKAVDIGLPRPDISELILKSPKLKSFGLEWKANSAFLISTFGNKLSDLELQGRDSHSSMDIDNTIGNALSRISNLKRLSIKSCLSIAGFITLALEANSTTLEEFQFCDRDANHLLANLTMTNVLLCNVTTLYVNTKILDMQCFRRLPSVFPGIKYLEMVLPAKMQPKRSELLLVLSKLECLNGVSLKTRFLDVPSANETDPLKKYSIPYMGCDVQKPLILF